MNFAPDLENKMLDSYQVQLRKKADNIDLHSIKNNVYEKIGFFDYGKFSNDLNSLMNEFKEEFSNFDLIKKQYKIDAPEITIDKK